MTQNNLAYSIFELPVINWYFFNESLQKSEPDFSYLFKEKNKEISIQDGFDAYAKIIEKMPFVFAELKVNYLKLLLATNIFQLNILLGKKENYKKDLQRTNVFLGEYIANFGNQNESFFVDFFSLKKDWQKILTENFDFEIPEIFNTVLKGGFNLPTLTVFEWFAGREFGVNFNLIVNDFFINNCVEIKQVRFNKLSEFLSIVENLFTENNCIDDYILLRPHLVNISNDNLISNNKDGGGIKQLYDTLFSLESFAKITIDPQRDSLYKFLVFLESANKLADNQPHAV